MSSSSSKRSFQQRDEEPWLHYPDSNTMIRDYSRSSAALHKQPQPTSSFDHLDNQHQHAFQSQSMPQQQPHRTTATATTSSPLGTPSSKHKRTLSRVNASSSSSAYYHHQPTSTAAAAGGIDHAFGYPQTHHYRSSFSSRRNPQPRTLSEELSMALQQNPPPAEDNYPSPITPSGLLSSPADMSMLSSSAASSTSTLSSSGHFPLFKPSPTPPSSSQQNNQQKPRPSPLSLNNNFNSHGQSAGQGQGSPSFSLRPGSPTSAVSRDSTTAQDIAGSPRAASAAIAANLGTSVFSSSTFSPLLPRSNLHHQTSREQMSSAASTSSSSYYSSASSPRSSFAPCSALCHHNNSNSTGDDRYSHHQHHGSCLHSSQHSNHHRHRSHHPACQHHSNQPLQPEPVIQQQGPKPGRATKGIQRFGFPQFRPEMDDSHLGSHEKMAVATMKTTSTSTSGSTGYGMQRGHHEDDFMDGLDSPTYASEPPKKRLRSTASMLLDAAVETVIFTGAVALSAYQLLTGKGKSGSGYHSKQASLASEDMDGVRGDEGEAVKAQEEDPMEEKLALQLDATTLEASRSLRGYPSSGTLGRSSSRMTGYHKARTPRASRVRQSYSAPGSQHIGHTRSPSMPVRPNTGTEDTDEAFLRMEAQLNSLIAEGKRALNSRIEVWDEE